MSDQERIARLERRIKGIYAVFTLAGLGLLAIALNAQPSVVDVLRARRLIIVDDKGVERVVIGAPLPDPVVNGKRVKRSGVVSGMIVLDAKGNERGGFSTADASGEVLFALDSETQQETLFLVNPKGGSHFSIFDGNRNLVRMGVLDGRPTLVVREKGVTLFEQPVKP
jgi:hypothetical protein